MKHPSWVFSVVATGTLAFSMAGCSSGDTSESGESTSEGVKTVKFMTWESAETNALIDSKVEELWKNESIKIERVDAPSGDYGSKLGSLAQANQLPDIFWCGNDTEQQYSQMGMLIDWTDHIGTTVTAEDFGGLEQWTTENGIGGLPALRNIFGVWYNQDLFEEAGVPLPELDWTWDDLYAAAEKLTGAGGSKYGLTVDMYVTTDGPFAMSQYSVSDGGAHFTDSVHTPTKVEMDSSYLEGVEKLTKAVEAGYVAPPDYDVSNTASLFAAGQQPMMIGGQWQAQSFVQDAKDITWAWAPIPSQKDQTALYDAIGMCSPASTEDPDATFEALTFIGTEVLPAVMAETPVAPTAYIPGQQPYFDSLTEMGATTVVDTLEYTMQAPNTVNLRFTTPWASQANDLTTRDYLPVLKGEKPVSVLEQYVKDMQGLVDAG